MCVCVCVCVYVWITCKDATNSKRIAALCSKPINLLTRWQILPSFARTKDLRQSLRRIDHDIDCGSSVSFSISSDKHRKKKKKKANKQIIRLLVLLLFSILLLLLLFVLVKSFLKTKTKLSLLRYYCLEYITITVSS